MIDKNEFESIRKEIDDLEAKRELLIQKSREIIKMSKQVIYAVHRDDIKSALKAVEAIKREKIGLEKLSKEDVGSDMGKVAMQEYVEALCYYEFVRNKKIPTRSDLKVSTEEYLMGLCDLTGELVRKAVADVINKRFKGAVIIKDLVDEIYGEFLKFNLRNSELRKKSDQIKWNLKKLEDVFFDAQIKGRI